LEPIGADGSRRLYLPSEQFPQGGKMTTGFHQLQVDDEIELKGPLGSFVWQGRGTAHIKGTPRTFKEIGMVCGGSGITPILQVLRAILHELEHTDTRLWLICSNKVILLMAGRDRADVPCRPRPTFSCVRSLTSSVSYTAKTASAFTIP
jgi:nitrate reductase (NAD(P)H)